MNIMNLINALPGAVAQGLIWGIMAIGVYVTFRILDIADLTVDGTMATGGAVCIMMMMSGYNIWVSMLAATGAGMLAGLATGLFHTFMGIPAILAGILTQLSLYSVNLVIMGKANQSINVNNYKLLVSLRYVSGVSFLKNTITIVAIILIILIAVLYWFFGTEFGCSLRATGCNPNMSRAQGINTDINKVIGLMLSNGLVAFSSALLAQYQGFADISMGRGAIVIGLAAVIIGEAIFGKIFQNFALKLVAVALGSVLYYLVLQIVIWLGINTNLLKLFSALLVAVFLAVPYWHGKYLAKPVRRTAVSGNQESQFPEAAVHEDQTRPLTGAAVPENSKKPSGKEAGADGMEIPEGESGGSGKAKRTGGGKNA